MKNWGGTSYAQGGSPDKRGWIRKVEICLIWSERGPSGVGRIIVWYPAHLYIPVLVPTAIREFSSSIQRFFDQKSCLWAALIYLLPIFHFPNPFQTLTQLCHRIELAFTITTVLHSILYLFWKPRNGSCRFLCLHALSRHPLDVYGRIICPWKGIYEGKIAQLKSWETVQWGRSYSRNKFDEYGP